mmetsp:Transcript_55586/g.148205  ORF Transcript_55586/g.148205 Transcript_55586/m.148205 type:complete len:237 (-) Transcript_55586:224-934(-)
MLPGLGIEFGDHRPNYICGQLAHLVEDTIPDVNLAWSDSDVRVLLQLVQGQLVPSLELAVAVPFLLHGVIVEMNHLVKSVGGILLRRSAAVGLLVHVGQHRAGSVCCNITLMHKTIRSNVKLSPRYQQWSLNVLLQNQGLFRPCFGGDPLLDLLQGVENTNTAPAVGKFSRLHNPDVQDLHIGVGLKHLLEMPKLRSVHSLGADDKGQRHGVEGVLPGCGAVRSQVAAQGLLLAEA